MRFVRIKHVVFTAKGRAVLESVLLDRNPPSCIIKQLRILLVLSWESSRFDWEI